MLEILLDRKAKEEKENQRIKVTKHNKLHSFTNYSYDKEGGNEMSFPATLQTLAKWNMTSGNSFQTAKIVSLLSATLPSGVWTVSYYSMISSLPPTHSE